MNLSKLIRKGRLDPVLKFDGGAIPILVGWSRRDGSRKKGNFTLKQSRPFNPRKDLPTHHPDFQDWCVEQDQWEEAAATQRNATAALGIPADRPAAVEVEVEVD